MGKNYIHNKFYEISHTPGPMGFRTWKGLRIIPLSDIFESNRIIFFVLGLFRIL